MATSYDLFLRGQDKTGPAINSAKRNFESFGGSVAKFGTALAGVLGAAGVGALLKNVVDTADRIDKLSSRLDASTEFLSQFNFALEQSGVQARTGATALQRLTRNASDAATKGVGAAAEAFRELGINAGVFTDLPLEQKVLVLADRLEEAAKQGRDVALAQKLMDSEGVALLQTFEGGADAVQEMLDKADELGRTIDQNTAKQAAELRDRMNELKSAMQGLATQTMPTVLSGITSFANLLNDEVIPRVELFARNILGLDKAIKDMSARQLEIEFQELVLRVRELDEIAETGGNIFNRLFGLDQEEAGQEAERLRERMAAIRAAVDELRAESTGGGPEDVPGLLGDPFFPSESERQKQNEIKQTRLEEDISFEQKKLELFQNLVARGQQQITKIETQETRKRRQFALYEATQQQRGFFQILTQTTQGVAQHNRVLFEINRVGAIANATIAALEGPAITEGSYPWPFGHILAGIHYASQIARIAAIVSTSYSGSGGGTPPSLATGGAPVTPVTATGETIDIETGQTTEAAEQTPVIQVNLMTEDAESTRRTIDRLNEEHANGYRLQVS